MKFPSSLQRASNPRKQAFPALLLIVLLLGAGCGFMAGKKKADENKGKKDEKQEKGVPVELTEIVRGPIEDVIKASNHLEAEQEVRVLSRAVNRAVELLVEEGDIVKKDQLLLKLQDDDQKTAYNKALSQLNQARADFKRQEGLFKDDLVSQREFDDVKYRVEQQQLALDEAQRQLDFTEIRAPIAGTIVNRLVKLGDQISSGQHLFDIIDFDSIVARVYVPEKHLPDLKVGKEARITAQSLGERVFEGSIKRIAPVVDSKSGTVKITLAVKTEGVLLPGMFVDAEIIVDRRPKALLITKRAIVYDNDQMFVFRLGASNRVKRVLVAPVLADKDHVEPAGGFEEGDRIVIAGQTGLKEDALVTLPGEGVEETEDEPPREDKDGKKTSDSSTSG